MKKEHQYLIAGAVVSAAVLLGVGVAGDEKQEVTSAGRFQYINTSGNPDVLYGSPTDTTAGVTHINVFYVLDSETGTVNSVGRGGETIVFPFSATPTK